MKEKEKEKKETFWITANFPERLQRFHMGAPVSQPDKG